MLVVLLFLTQLEKHRLFELILNSIESSQVVVALEHDVSFTCKECKTENNLKIEGLQNFFG